MVPRISPIGALAAAALVAAAGMSANVSASETAPGKEITVTLTNPGQITEWTVPDGVRSVTVDLYGAQGGSSDYHEGGRGGEAKATLQVTPGQKLYINVGGQGKAVKGEHSGGSNGGGEGSWYGGYLAAGGGGASDILDSKKNKLVVAGGGGGAGIAGIGGAGGDILGGSAIGGSATGGTQTEGGTGDNTDMFGCRGNDGSLGKGGDGYSCRGAGGGGGGGYYGGGSGTACNPGAGGSSFIIYSATGFAHKQGEQSGNGKVVLTYTEPAVPSIQ